MAKVENWVRLAVSAETRQMASRLAGQFAMKQYQIVQLALLILTRLEPEEISEILSRNAEHE